MVVSIVSSVMLVSVKWDVTRFVTSIVRNLRGVPEEMVGMVSSSVVASRGSVSGFRFGVILWMCMTRVAIMLRFGR